MSKSGTCYDATGTVDASIAISVQNGVLKVDPTVEIRSPDVDIPWYCYVVARPVGGRHPAGCSGIIGAVVGSILLPTIMYVTENVMETAVNSAAAAVANAINNAAPAIDLAVPDVKVACRPSGTSRSSSPTRSSMMSRSIRAWYLLTPFPSTPAAS